MLRRRPKLALGAALLLLGLAAAPLGADLEVTVPPGSPYDWGRGYPQPALTGIGRVPRVLTGGRPQGGGSVEVLDRGERRPVSPSSIFDFSGITTRDLPVELPWTRPPETQGQRVPITGAERRTAPQLRYPPMPTDHMHWLAMAVLLRSVMHSAQVSQAAVLEHLVRLGQPARLAARRALDEPALRDVGAQILRRVGAPSSSRPKLQRARDPEEQMILRLAWIELASGTPYEPGIPFARRLRWLEDDGATAVLAYSKQRHDLMRRNATVMLARYNRADTQARLRELASDDDDVVRNRAIAGLALRRDRLALPLLTRLLSRKQPIGLRVLAAEALGRIGDPGAVGALLDFWEAEDDDVDAWWAAAPAIARLAPRDQASVDRVRQLVAGLLRKPKRFEPRSKDRQRFARIVPDNRDPLDRSTATLQLGRLALAACGDQPALEWLIKLLDDDRAELAEVRALQADYIKMRDREQELIAEWVERRSDRDADLRLRAQVDEIRAKMLPIKAKLAKLRPGWRPLAGPLGIVLRKLVPAGRYLALDVLAGAGKRGHELLRAVALDPHEDARLRAHALERLDIGKLVAFVEVSGALAAIAEDKEIPMLVRVAALRKLDAADPDAAVASARKLIAAYLVQSASRLPGLKVWGVLEALTLLGRRGKAALAELEPLLKLAAAERLEARKLQAAQNQRGLRVRFGAKVYNLPPVLEVVQLEIGRAAADQRRPAEERRKLQALLAKQLASEREPGRPHAALALGGVPGESSREALLERLDDTDPFVRLMASRALRAHGPQPQAARADWIWGSQRDRAQAIKAWRAAK